MNVEQRKPYLLAPAGYDALVRYLSQRPYAEVAGLMTVLLNAPTANLQPKTENGNGQSTQ